MKPTFIAFTDLQIKHGPDWKKAEGMENTNFDWFECRSNDAEVHLVAIDGTLRQLFFRKGAVIRITGNVLWFNAAESDYLITDHDKKFS